jgi:hypothetical protein
MELPQGLEEGRAPAQDPSSQKMGLGMKGLALQPPILALTHDPLHILLQDLQVVEQDPLELVAALRIRRHLFHPGQRQGDVALEDFLTEGLRATKAAMSQLLNLPHAQVFPAHRHHKLLNLLFAHPVHAHELA